MAYASEPPPSIVGCHNPICDMKVPTLRTFCCVNCANAATGHYELDVHTEQCVRRQYIRNM